MSIFSDPRNAINVELQPCQIGRNLDCGDLADGQCDECGKLVCGSPSCSVELPEGGWRCVDCADDMERVAAKEQLERKAA